METRPPERPHDIIAQAVIAEIQRRGVTVTWVAEISGVHRTAVARWLNGGRDVRTSTATKILEALDLTIASHDEPSRAGCRHHAPGRSCEPPQAWAQVDRGHQGEPHPLRTTEAHRR